jgi:hypothetical protein
MSVRKACMISAVILLVLGLSTPIWAADNCQCDAQALPGGVFRCNSGTCTSGNCIYTGQLPQPGIPGYWACSCSGVTSSYCHTVIVYDDPMTYFNFNCSGDCPVGHPRCLVGISPCGNGATECSCGL